MRVVANRSAGTIIAGAGLLLTGFHLSSATGFETSALAVLVTLLPVVFSLVMTAVGVQVARGRLVPDRFAGRMLAWTGVGVTVLFAFGLWMFAVTLVLEVTQSSSIVPMVNVATFGALVGLLVGLYDVRRLEQRQSVEQLNRINDTLRVATEELVNQTDRKSLEQAVCDRLSESAAYESVWVGRYDDAEGVVRPAAWSGLDDDYYESIDVTVDDSPTGGGPGGRAIREREIQCVPNVFADPSMEPWWDILESRGVQSMAVVPIGHEGTVYGFISIYADRPNVFEEREQAVLTDLGETIGHAIASIQANERLAERERELARQNQRLEEFAGIVSHDLRNPLTVAVGNLQLARETGDEECFSKAADALERMDELIADLLTLARQGEAIDEFEPVPLREVVEEAWATTGSDSSTLVCEDDLGTLSADRSRLRQLLENVFRNAVEHGSTSPPSHAQEDGIEHGGPDVTVTVRRTDGGFAVEDDGPGIPADRREAIFDVGYSTNEDGTGFGLDIVRSIVDAHGWDVAVGESPSGGARFDFSDVERVEPETEPA